MPEVKIPIKLKELIEPIENIHLSDRNIMKGHPVDMLAESLVQLGWHAPIVATKSGEIIVGNGRYKAAEKLGLEKIPVLRVDDDDKTAVARMIADNRLGEFSTWDLEHLDDLVNNYDIDSIINGMDLDGLLCDLGDPNMELVTGTGLDDGKNSYSTANKLKDGKDRPTTTLIAIGDVRFLISEVIARQLKAFLQKQFENDTPYGETFEALVALNTPPLDTKND